LDDAKASTYIDIIPRLHKRRIAAARSCREDQQATADGAPRIFRLLVRSGRFQETMTVKIPLRFLFFLLIVSSASDKLGLRLPLADHPITLYKLLFPFLLFSYVLLSLISGATNHRGFDRGLYRIIAASVLIQTAASLLGQFLKFGEISYLPELFHFVQTSSLLVIPLLAATLNIEPKHLLKIFMLGILIHFISIAFQFATPNAFQSLTASIDKFVDPRQIVPDNALNWDGKSLDFIGLQRTANYGIFTAAFGILILAFTPRSWLNKLSTYCIALLSIFFVLFSYSRAVFVMVAVFLLLLLIKAMTLSQATRFRCIRLSAIAAVLISSLFILKTVGVMSIRTDTFTAVYAFIDPQKEGSTQGKLSIAENAWPLFSQSPLVGYGGRSFTDIQVIGGLSVASPATHSYCLSVLLSSGIIGFIAYFVTFILITRALWRGGNRDQTIICALFVGLGVYNVIYDAGALDVFACFNGIAAYYALRSPKPQSRHRARVIAHSVGAIS
jgi:O-antigen ligase